MANGTYENIRALISIANYKTPNDDDKRERFKSLIEMVTIAESKAESKATVSEPKKSSGLRTQTFWGYAATDINLQQALDVFCKISGFQSVADKLFVSRCAKRNPLVSVRSL
jgi:hypothetical protein